MGTMTQAAKFSSGLSTRVTPRVLQWIFSVLVVSFVLFSLAPTFYELSRVGDLRPERQFELVHNFPTDYNFYLSRIRQGLEGRWTAVERYTSEPHAGSFIHDLYVLMGQTGRFVRVPIYRPGDIYHVARIVFAVLFLVVAAEFCRRTFAKYANGGILAVGAFLLGVTASSWPKLVAVVNNSVVPATLDTFSSWRFGGYMAWWSVMDSLQRITFIPHILLGQALIVVLCMLLTRPERFSRAANVVFTGLLVFLLGMVFPPGLIFLYAVIGIWWMISGKRVWKWFVPYAVMALMGATSLFYLMLMTSFYPWKRLAEVDIIRPLPFDYLEYVRALGPMLPIGVAGLVIALFRWETAMFPAVSWVLGWGMLLMLFSFVPQQSPLRFSEMAPHIPLGILSAYFLRHLYHVRYVRNVSRVTAITLVGVGLFHMYSSFLWQKDFVDHKIRATLPLVPTGSFVMYPLKDFINAMWYIADATGGKGVILSESTAGNYLPVISGNTVYAGHDNTVAFEGKKERVKQFFAGNMDDSEAHAWLKQAGVTYVFYGPQEKEDGGLSDLRRAYPFLVERYRNGYVAVYQAP